MLHKKRSFSLRISAVTADMVIFTAEILLICLRYKNFRNLPSIADRECFEDIVKDEKIFSTFTKSFIIDVCHGFKYTDYMI